MRDLGRVVLQVAIHGDDEVSPRRLKTSRQRGRFAEITPQSDAVSPRLPLRQLADCGPGSIGTAVIDIVNFDALSRAARDFAYLGLQNRQTLLLITNGDNDGDHISTPFGASPGPGESTGTQ